MRAVRLACDALVEWSLCVRQDLMPSRKPSGGLSPSPKPNWKLAVQPLEYLPSGAARRETYFANRASRVSKALITVSGPQGEEVIDLKDPAIAAFLGWLIPGLGHLYQGRTLKGLLFMVCILSTYFFGLAISEGKAVYAWWSHDDWRLPYLCQLGVGLPATPALVQSYLVRSGKQPLLGGIMAPPTDNRELDSWYKDLNRYLELGIVYTMIAGLLNVLAIYDAFAGPVQLVADDKRRREEPSPAPSS